MQLYSFVKSNTVGNSIDETTLENDIECLAKK